MRIITPNGDNVEAVVLMGIDGSVSDSSKDAASRNTTALRSAAREASHQFATTEKQLIKLSGYNYGPAQYIQIHDLATAPADGVVPREVSFLIQSNSSFELNPDGASDGAYTNGIYVCNSSTEFTKTIGADNCRFTVEVV
jgi:hypothetical protein